MQWLAVYQYSNPMNQQQDTWAIAWPCKGPAGTVAAVDAPVLACCVAAEHDPENNDNSSHVSLADTVLKGEGAWLGCQTHGLQCCCAALLLSQKLAIYLCKVSRMIPEQ